MIRTLLKISFILFLAVNIQAQTTGGSNYSILGVGDLQESNSSVYDALGNTAIAIPSSHAINIENPAMWSFSKYTRLQLGYKFNQHISNQNDKTLLQNNGQVNGIMGLFAVDTTMGISASFGLIPYSTVSYYIATPVNVNYDGLELDGRTYFRGDGGISRFYLGAGSKITDWLRFGFQTHFNIGAINTEVETILDDGRSYTSRNTKIDHFTGVGIKAGLSIEPVPDLLIGAFFENNFSTNVESEVTYDPDFATDSTFTNDLNATLPISFGIGTSYRTGRFVLGADLGFRNFDNYEYLNAPNTKFRSTMEFSLGGMRLGNRRSGANFEDKLTYNFGLGYRELYYSVFGEDINELYGGFGISMPVVGTAMIDASAVLGRRGTTANGLIEEYYLRLMFNISLGETWFKPFRRNY